MYCYYVVLTEKRKFTFGFLRNKNVLRSKIICLAILLPAQFGILSKKFIHHINSDYGTINGMRCCLLLLWFVTLMMVTNRLTHP